MRCPRCRKGRMYNSRNPWNMKKVFAMPDRCPECGQKFELETGFWFGTAYVSYALTVAYLVATFVAWWVLIGFSIKDNRFFWWMGFAIISLLVLQPWFMRISRVIYLSFFVKYDPAYKEHPPVKFDNY